MYTYMLCTCIWVSSDLYTIVYIFGFPALFLLSYYAIQERGSGISVKQPSANAGQVDIFGRVAQRGDGQGGYPHTSK